MAKLGALRAVGHNIADSFASGIGLMIGVYEMNVFAEASSGSFGYIEVDFLRGSSAGETPSPSLRQAIVLYSEEFPRLCTRHGLSIESVKCIQARFGVDRVYGPHFTVTVEDERGRRSVDRYVGLPGRRVRTRGKSVGSRASSEGRNLDA